MSDDAAETIIIEVPKDGGLPVEVSLADYLADPDAVEQEVLAARAAYALNEDGTDEFLDFDALERIAALNGEANK